MNVKLFFKRTILTLAIALTFSTSMYAATYIITKSGSNFVATIEGGGQVASDATLQNVINAIKTSANGQDCTIQFGANGATNPLDLGGGSGVLIVFNNTDGNWGKITLTGKATASNTTTAGTRPAIQSYVTIDSKVDLTATGAQGTGFHNNTGGTLNIISGTVQATGGGYAVSNFGTLNISGGTVKGTAANGRAILNFNGAQTTISGNAIVTSVNTSATGGTIDTYSTDPQNDWIIKIEGGTVENTAANGNAIHNSIQGAIINITGGTVQATANGGKAIFNNNTGTINIEGGTVSATTGRAILNNSTGTINISGGTVSATTGNAISNNSSGQVVIISGTVEATGNEGQAIYNDSGVVNISGNSVIRSTTGQTINNENAGRIIIAGNSLVTSARSDYIFPGTIFLDRESSSTAERLLIEGGTVENTAGGDAIFNGSVGAVTITGGTVSSTGTAIDNYTTGKITISGTTTKITSASEYGAIILEDNGAATAVRLEITGGTVENTATNGNAILNASSGAITVSGGIICAKKGYAIKITKSAPLTLNEVGTVFAYGETDTEVISGVYTQSGKAVVVAWDVLAGVTQYTAGTSNNIYKLPETATTVWAKQSGIGGISVVHGANKCFIPIASITINAPTHHVTVVSGSGSGDYEEGDLVTITANPAPAGQQFKEWIMTTPVTFADGADATSPTAKFNMPTTDVTATATYQPETGIEELSLESGALKIYPNPTSGELKIKNYELKIENVEIFDVYGRKVLNFQRSISNSIDVSQLANGIYLLKMGNKTAKFVKQ